MKYMLVVCKEHVKDGITRLEVPHEKKLGILNLPVRFAKKKLFV
jgi:hypothetical protein